MYLATVDLVSSFMFYFHNGLISFEIEIVYCIRKDYSFCFVRVTLCFVDEGS